MDGGLVLSSHISEFGNRVRIMNTGAEDLGHMPPHVGGTLAAAGLDPAARGVISGILESYDWDNDLEMEAAASAGSCFSNHSYGYILGWDYNIDESRWEWYGDPEISATEDYYFGYYNEEAGKRPDRL
ncbi:MAG: hypothetical protein R2751_08335 [Bacteroidales bacterium]